MFTNKKEMKKEKKNNRKIWLDIVKILACFCVLINHTAGILLKYNSEKVSNNIFYIFQFSFCKIGVPLFIMVTGVLILNKKYQFKDILKKIVRILVPLLALSIIFNFKNNGFNILFIKEIIERPQSVYLWYLYMLIGLYLITPIVQKMIINFENKDYLYLIIICFVIPKTLAMLSSIFNISVSYYFNLSLLPVIIVYFVSGVYIEKIKKNIVNRNIALVLFIMSYFLYILSYLLPYLNSVNISYTFDSYDNLLVGLMAMSIFYLIRYYFESKNIKFEKCISIISLTTFGIYLIHTIFNYKIYNFILTKYIFRFNNIIGILFVEIVCFLLCSFIIYIFKKIPIVKKFL